MTKKWKKVESMSTSYDRRRDGGRDSPENAPENATENIQI